MSNDTSLSSQYFSQFDVTTVMGERFTGEESAMLFALIHKRFGHNGEATGEAVGRLMQSTPAPDQAVALAQRGAALLTAKGIKL